MRFLSSHGVVFSLCTAAPYLKKKKIGCTQARSFSFLSFLTVHILQEQKLCRWWCKTRRSLGMRLTNRVPIDQSNHYQPTSGLKALGTRLILWSFRSAANMWHIWSTGLPPTASVSSCWIKGKLLLALQWRNSLFIEDPGRSNDKEKQFNVLVSSIFCYYSGNNCFAKLFLLAKASAQNLCPATCSMQANSWNFTCLFDKSACIFDKMCPYTRLPKTERQNFLWISPTVLTSTANYFILSVVSPLLLCFLCYIPWQGLCYVHC